MSKKENIENFNIDDYMNTQSADNPKSVKEVEPIQQSKKTASVKQRRATLEDYQQTYLSVPKITDRKTVFISNELRERIVDIVRKLGTEKSSVSGFIENLVIHHLEEYKEDVDSWKKL